MDERESLLYGAKHFLQRWRFTYDFGCFDLGFLRVLGSVQWHCQCALDQRDRLIDVEGFRQILKCARLMALTALSKSECAVIMITEYGGNVFAIVRAGFKPSVPCIRMSDTIGG